jgi:hypothetical protein
LELVGTKFSAADNAEGTNEEWCVVPLQHGWR